MIRERRDFHQLGLGGGAAGAPSNIELSVVAALTGQSLLLRKLYVPLRRSLQTLCQTATKSFSA